MLEVAGPLEIQWFGVNRADFAALDVALHIDAMHNEGAGTGWCAAVGVFDERNLFELARPDYPSFGGDFSPEAAPSPGVVRNRVLLLELG